MKKPKISKRIILRVLYAIIIIDVFFFGMMVTYLPNPFQARYPASNEVNCSNMSLPDAARCIRDFVAPKYKFVIRDDTDKSIEDVLENGGDCYDYSLLYAKLAKASGIQGEVAFIDFGPTADVGHAIAILADKNFGYCTMEATFDPHCVKLSFRNLDANDTTDANLTLTSMKGGGKE